ncbi:glycosyltransferase family 2 protein [Chlorobium sp. N1]|uniref:glycosyltransferase family 2 protein n=1 Tax=Chlorobium sp. N1 TaxID=2491138 RepID=UPI00103BD9F7|nr:glycosyltransferase family 2 protein [Chlorobium sp. N1]TCD46869.1 glycosyltransferase family 2 protein [Chlorobium sp. N1]
MIAVSVVSHGHGDMVGGVVEALLQCPLVLRVIVTRNVPEELALPDDERITLIVNDEPMGFAQNHNRAFRYCDQPYFCVLNPDIRLLEDPFPSLLSVMEAHGASLGAPLVVSADGSVEDSVRRFPTVRSLVSKALGGEDGRYHVRKNDAVLFPEWVAGMFLLFRAEDFKTLGGFDERFYLYYEDVDICVRLWRAGLKIAVSPSVAVVHDARRASRRELRHMQLHAGSLARYFRKHFGRLPTVPYA